MPTKIICKYAGDNQTELVHVPTGARILTDLPQDNGGKGRTFSPTDLLAASLAACALTIMGKLAQRDGVDFSNAEISVEKEMSSQPPRRVAKLRLKAKLPASLTQEQKRKYLASISACPVHLSLHPEVESDWEK